MYSDVFKVNINCIQNIQSEFIVFKVEVKAKQLLFNHEDDDDHHQLK